MVITFRHAALLTGTLAAVLLAAPAHGHGIAVDVTVDGTTLRGAARYSDRSPVAREQVFLFSPPQSQEPIASVTTAGDGRFTFEGAPGRSYRVMIDAGEGHEVEREVTVPAAAAAAPAPAAGGLTRAELDAALLPLREDLARLERQWRLTDLFAGLSYLFGAYGLVAWLRSRKA